MMKEQSVLHISCQESIYVGQLLTILVEINFTHATQIVSLTGFFEGKFHTKISNQVEFRQIVALRIEFDALIRQWRTRSGEIYAPAGQHKAETTLVIGEEYPGTYSAKYGSIEYLIAVKLCITGQIGHSELVMKRPVRVISGMDITRYLPFHVPVHIERYFHKKLFCLRKSSIKVFIRLPKTAFVQGEAIIIYGEISNEHQKNLIKGGIIKLVTVVRFRCKGSEKFTNDTLSHFALPMIPQSSIIKFQQCLQIPNNAFPTYSYPHALINSFYHISIMLNECTPIEIPIIIGTGIPIPSINVQNYQPSLFTIAGHIKIRPFSSMLKQQAFPSPINSPQFLPISQLHSSLLPIPSPSLPISSFYFYPNFDKSHFNSLPLYHSNSKATVFPEDFPVTRYKGQSVLRIEEIE